MSAGSEGIIVRARKRLRDTAAIRTALVRLRTAVTASRARRNGVLFLFYHDILAGERSDFERQLTQLQNYGDIVSIDKAIRSTTEGGSDRFICLTFDDGYDGAIKHGLPILTDRSLPATFFIVPGWIDAARPGVANWDSCRALVQNGMEVGSHSMTHRRLSGLDQREVLSEMVASRVCIEEELRLPCRHFACPWGQPKADFLIERDPALAREAGYRSFFTTLPHRAPAHASPYLLPRVRMEPGWGDTELRYAFCR
jgi:peptidoglycan/xylan/chitin deacetylase (PgdA/CDA1 family)